MVPFSEAWVVRDGQSIAASAELLCESTAAVAMY